MYFSLPKEYREASNAELIKRINSAREKLGSKLTILAHHYQRMEIVAMGDHVGDSYGLSKIAAEQKDVAYIVFCGVHFMAESADILTDDSKTVFLPNPLAGCPMADMAEMADVLEAWEYLEEFGGDDKIMPISYMNTAAGLKAFTGKHGGLICTSSNAAGAYKYGFKKKEKLFFFPDEHLGYNTGITYGIKPEEMIVWDFAKERGGLTHDQIAKSKVILWKGHCHVHTNFKLKHIEAFRQKYPDGKILVHPECPHEIVKFADAAGSTKFIVEYCENAPDGTTIAIGTELNLVNRMAKTFDTKHIIGLSGETCAVCANMYRTTLNDLAFTLENLDDIKPIRVTEPTKSDALTALQKMLAVS